MAWRTRRYFAAPLLFIARIRPEEFCSSENPLRKNHINLNIKLKKGPTMSTTLNVAFVKQFEKEIHEAYQRLGSKLKGTVRQASNVKGSSTVFQKVGTTSSVYVTSHSNSVAGIKPIRAIGA